MKKSYIFHSLALLAVSLAACNEAPFSSERDGKNKYGEFHKSALTFNVQEENGVMVQTRASSVNIDDFTLTFTRDGEVERTLKYGDMPEVMMLEEGTYTIEASYGTITEAQFDNPCFSGTSDEFVVQRQSITSNINPIVCNLQNVKVTVSFDKDLADAASDDSFIEVKVQNRDGLKFFKNPELQELYGDKYEDAGYFFTEGAITLVATFNGSLFGSEVQQETKSLSDIEGGNFYKMTFSLHGHNGISQGDSDGRVNIDGSVEYENMENNVVIKDQLIDDSERPGEDEPGGEEPGDNSGDNSGDDDPSTTTTEGPVVTPSSGISLDDWNVNPSECALTITSKTGVTGFLVDIKSNALSPQELAQVGLAAHMNLITGMGTSPEGVENDMAEALAGLGLPVKEQVENETEIKFDISKFMDLLASLGAGDHTFVLTITDASGTVQKELKIRII